jgi:predicted MFS family arabinose efflux permease
MTGAFWTYGGIGIFAWIVLYFALPETKGKTIEEIQSMFRTKSAKPLKD